MVSEGALNWSMAAWLRRLVTRSISITPSIIIAGAVGRGGLSAALNATQVVLSVVLPFVSAPLIYFTCRERYMTVENPSCSVGLVADGVSGVSGLDGEMVRVGARHSIENISGVGEGNRDGTAADAASTELRRSDHATASLVPRNSFILSTELEAGVGAGVQNHENMNGNGNRNGNGNGNGTGDTHRDHTETGTGNAIVKMGNHWVTTVFAVLIWIIIAVMNVANLALLKNQ